MEKLFSTYAPSRTPGIPRTSRHLVDDVPNANFSSTEAQLLSRRSSHAPSTVQPAQDVSPCGHETALCYESPSSVDRQSTASHTQENEYREHRTMNHISPSNSRAELVAGGARKEVGIESSSDSASLQPKGAAASDYASRNSLPPQHPVEFLSVKPRVALGCEVEGDTQEHEPQCKKQAPSNVAANFYAAKSPSEAAPVRDLQNFSVQQSCSGSPQREDNCAHSGSTSSLTRFMFAWWRRRSRIRIRARKLTQCIQSDHRRIVNFLPRSSRKRVAENVDNNSAPDQSNRPGLHALPGDARDVEAPARNSTSENVAHQDCRRRKNASASPAGSHWLTFQRVLRIPGKCASQFKKRFSTMMDQAFNRHAMLVYDYKWHFIVASLVISGLMAVGLLFRKYENDMYKLYSFSGAPSYQVKEQFLSHFPRIRTSYIIAYSDYDSLKPDTLAALHKIDEQIRNITLQRDAITVDEFGDPLERHAEFNSLAFPPTVTFEDVCARDSWGDCSVMSVLNMYTSSHAWGRPIVCRKWPIVVNFRTKKAYRADAMLGNIRVVEKAQGDSVLHIIQNATAFGIRYDLLGEAGWEHYSAALEERIKNIVFQSDVPGMRLALRAERSISDDLIKSSQLGQWDSILLTVAVLVVLMYTLGVNSTLNFRTKTLPAFMGVLSTLFGYAGGAGFIYLCGLLHTPPAEATPFLVLGIGVDNAFVLINSYSLTFLIADPRERIRHTTRDAGLAITCTTMTSVTALIIGAASPYASISMFCVITAFCLFWGYVMSLTFFLGWLVLDAQREARHLQQVSLHCREGELSESAAKTVKDPGCLEAGASARPESPVPSEVENTLPISFVQSAEACTAQNTASYAPMGALGSNTFTADTNLSARKERHAVWFSGKPNGTSNVMRPNGDARVLLGRSHLPCGIDCGAHKHQEAPEEAGKRNPQERTVMMGETGQVPEDNYVDGIAQSQSNMCTRRSKSGTCQLMQGYISPAEENLILEQMKYMSTFQLASLMAFRPRLETTLQNKGERAIYVQLAVPPHCNSGGYTDAQSDQAGEDRGRSGGVPARKLPHSGEGGGTFNDVLVCPATKTEKGQEADSTGADDRRRISSCDYADASLKCLVMNASYLKHWFDAYLHEPQGNVGRLGRAFLIKYYCRMLARPWVQAVVLAFFAVVCGISIYGFTKIQPGITVDEICPKDSYLRTFFEVRSRYFSTLGEEITIFFPEPERWQDKALQDKLVEVHDTIFASHHAVAINNGMYYFIKQKQKDLVDGDKANFLQALYTWLYSDLVGKQYRTHFVFSFPTTYSEERAPPNAPGEQAVLPESLVSWKFVYWMPHVENTSVLYEWLKETRLILQDVRTHFHGLAYTPLAILWESDPYILKCTVSNLLYALVAIVLMTVALIPNFFSMLIVALIVFLVDLALCGFMAIWGLRLNMLTMVILLLAIGYSVDTTTHVLNAFTRCCGGTRRDRMVETMVLIGNAIANGMLSTLMAVFFLKGSDKFVLEVFFKMMILVLAFAFGFGFIFLPVLLQLFGPMARNDQVVKLLDTSTNLSSSGSWFQGVCNSCERVKPATPESLVVQQVFPGNNSRPFSALRLSSRIL